MFFAQATPTNIYLFIHRKPFMGFYFSLDIDYASFCGEWVSCFKSWIFILNGII